MERTPVGQNNGATWQPDVTWLLNRYAALPLLHAGRSEWRPQLVDCLRAQYRSLLKPSQALRRWAVRRAAGFSGIGVSLNGGILAGRSWAAMLGPWTSAPMFWPNVPMAWYSPLWRRWLMQYQGEPYIPEELTPGRYGAEVMGLSGYLPLTLPSTAFGPPGAVPATQYGQYAALLPGVRPASRLHEALAQERQRILSPLPLASGPVGMLTLDGIVNPSSYYPEAASHSIDLLHPGAFISANRMGRRAGVWTPSGVPGTVVPTYFHPQIDLGEAVLPLSVAESVPMLAGVGRQIGAMALSSRSGPLTRLAGGIGNVHHFSPLVGGAGTFVVAPSIEPRMASPSPLTMPLVASNLPGLGFPEDSNVRPGSGEVSWTPGGPPEDAVGTRAPWVDAAFEASHRRGIPSPGAEFSLSKEISAIGSEASPATQKLLLSRQMTIPRNILKGYPGVLISAAESAGEAASPPTMAAATETWAVKAGEAAKSYLPHVSRMISDLRTVALVHRADAGRSVDGPMEPTAPPQKESGDGMPLSPRDRPLVRQRMVDTVHSDENERVALDAEEGAATRVPYQLRGGSSEEYGELAIAMQQAGGPGSARSNEPLSLVQRPAGHAVRPAGLPQLSAGGHDAGVSGGSEAGYRSLATPAISFSLPQVSSPSPALARAPVDRPTDDSPSPASAADAGSGQSAQRGQPPDLDAIAQEVYAILKRRLALERERMWGT